MVYKFTRGEKTIQHERKSDDDTVQVGFRRTPTKDSDGNASSQGSDSDLWPPPTFDRGKQPPYSGQYRQPIEEGWGE